MTSRRTILKSIGLVGLASLVPRHKFVNAKAITIEPEPHWQGQPLGRITTAVLFARSEPNVNAEVVTEMRQDDVIRVRRAITAQPVFDHNDIWLETAQGYLYSSFVQPMWYHVPNTPTAELGSGRWAELTVPYSDAYRDPDDSIGDRFVSRMYYGTVFRVTGYTEDEQGRGWYSVQEMYQNFYMRATHLRLIDNQRELSPISADVPADEKWIDIDLTAQRVTAYEGDTPVFTHLTTTGRRGHATPPGTHYVWDKRISERMVDGAAADDDVTDRYNLAGVPYVCYITDNWVALHGTFWHNDYGQVRSHGCINLPSSASQWLWRWTTPYVEGEGLNALYYRPNNRLNGTRVEVHY